MAYFSKLPASSAFFPFALQQTGVNYFGVEKNPAFFAGGNITGTVTRYDHVSHETLLSNMPRGR